jgi:hypothetical protein
MKQSYRETSAGWIGLELIASLLRTAVFVCVSATILESVLTLGTGSAFSTVPGTESVSRPHA